MFILLFTSFTLGVRATEISGGDLSVEQLNDSTFLLELRIYKYCNGNAAPLKIDSSSSSSLARIFDNSSNNLVKTFSSISFDSIRSLPLGDSCYTPPGLCIEVVYYSTRVILPPNPNGYYATWKVCCKNYEGNFIGSNDKLFYVQFPNPLIIGRNSSPNFNLADKDAYLCIGYEKTIDFSCTDKDGDSLAYSLITPFNDFSLTGSKPFMTSTYASGVSLNKILGLGSKCEIDSSTGFVTARPAQLGLYSISVKCEEFRNGTKLGEVTRTFIYSGLNCNLGIPIDFENFSTSYDFEISKNNCFDIVAKSSSLTDMQLNFSSNAFNLGAKVGLPDRNSVGKYDFEWNDVLFGITETAKNVEVTQTSLSQFYSNKDIVGARFCWELNDCEFYNNEKYYVDVQAILNRCGIMDTIEKRVNINFIGLESSINTPNVFSPNGDGIEDVFRIKKNEDNKCLQIVKTQIYNLTGQLVFESDNPNFFWNGKNFLDKDVSGGIYIVVYEGLYGETKISESFKLLLYR